MTGRTDDPSLGRDITRVVYDRTAIARRVRKLGADITDAFPDGPLLLLGLLKGSFIFLADLAREIHRPFEVNFVVASSYGDDTKSSGAVSLLYDPRIDLAGKHVVLVEDIVDSGRTLTHLLELLGRRAPRSLSVCALMHKRIADSAHDVRFVGFDAPKEFLVGYGLDHAEQFRHLPYVASLD
jgi:hypoxanthine phosphoribosyltransferase